MLCFNEHVFSNRTPVQASPIYGSSSKRCAIFTTLMRRNASRRSSFQFTGRSESTWSGKVTRMRKHSRVRSTAMAKTGMSHYFYIIYLRNIISRRISLQYYKCEMCALQSNNTHNYKLNSVHYQWCIFYIIHTIAHVQSMHFALRVSKCKGPSFTYTNSLIRCAMCMSSS